MCVAVTISVGRPSETSAALRISSISARSLPSAIFSTRQPAASNRSGTFSVNVSAVGPSRLIEL